MSRPSLFNGNLKCCAGVAQDIGCSLYPSQRRLYALFHSNWALSTARAVTVTEFLIGAGMRPQQLAAAGYSQFDPVSKKNKQENRRIEIALLPSIDELPQFPEDLMKAAEGKSETPSPAAR